MSEAKKKIVIPKGTIVSDTGKKQWIIGASLGGCQDIYAVAPYHAHDKVPQDYTKAIIFKRHGDAQFRTHSFCDAKAIDAWKRERKLRHLGVTPVLGIGILQLSDQVCSFMITQRYTDNLQRLLSKNKKGFTASTVYKVIGQMIYAVEYIHSKGYNDIVYITGRKLLQGFANPNDIYLDVINYGKTSESLTCRSRDAQVGTALGDLESVLFNALSWLKLRLPWQKNSANETSVNEQKMKAFEDVDGFLQDVFGKFRILTPIMHLAKKIASMGNVNESDYKALRTIISRGIQNLSNVDRNIDCTINFEEELVLRKRARKSVRKSSEKTKTNTSVSKKARHEGNQVKTSTITHTLASNGNISKSTPSSEADARINAIEATMHIGGDLLEKAVVPVAKNSVNNATPPIESTRYSLLSADHSNGTSQVPKPKTTITSRDPRLTLSLTKSAKTGQYVKATSDETTPVRKPERSKVTEPKLTTVASVHPHQGAKKKGEHTEASAKRKRLIGLSTAEDTVTVATPEKEPKQTEQSNQEAQLASPEIFPEAAGNAASNRLRLEAKVEVTLEEEPKDAESEQQQQQQQPTLPEIFSKAIRANVNDNQPAKNLAMTDSVSLDVQEQIARAETDCADQDSTLRTSKDASVVQSLDGSEPRIAESKVHDSRPEADNDLGSRDLLRKIEENPKLLYHIKAIYEGIFKPELLQQTKPADQKIKRDQLKFIDLTGDETEIDPGSMTDTTATHQRAALLFQKSVKLEPLDQACEEESNAREQRELAEKRKRSASRSDSRDSYSDNRNETKRRDSKKRMKHRDADVRSPRESHRKESGNVTRSKRRQEGDYGTSPSDRDRNKNESSSRNRSRVNVSPLRPSNNRNYSFPYQPWGQYSRPEELYPGPNFSRGCSNTWQYSGRVRGRGRRIATKRWVSNPIRGNNYGTNSRYSRRSRSPRENDSRITTSATSSAASDQTKNKNTGEKTAGSMDLQNLAEEDEERKPREEQWKKTRRQRGDFDQRAPMNSKRSSERNSASSVSSKNSELRNISRDESCSGQSTIIRNSEQNAVEEQERYEKWSEGLKQSEDRENRLKEDLQEMNKPLVRYANDEDSKRESRAVERDEDSMLTYVGEKTVKEGKGH